MDSSSHQKSTTMSDHTAFSHYIDNAVRSLIARRGEREAQLDARIAELNELKVSELAVFNRNIQQLKELQKTPKTIKQIAQENQQLQEENEQLERDIAADKQKIANTVQVLLQGGV